METAIQRNQWHIAADGESVPLIAKQAGFRNWRTVFEHPKNVEFRQKNPDPNIVRTGDVVWIPELTPGPGFVCETNKVNKLIVKTPKMQLNFVFNDDEKGFPYSNTPYEIWINDQKYGTENRRTTAAGEVKAEVPIVPELVIALWIEGEDEEPEVYTVYTGELDPIDTVEGVQDRLNNLGYDIIQEEEGRLGPNTIDSLKKFQEKYGLLSDGKLNEETREKLKEVHDLN